eukprot:TRINITY_DN11504_c0_g2_i5.p1 TRINITY_DN11504_c0_g2~~TRINITY_DN11504_c0_g2_i5.p1  ORF type:complete len:1114 (+),score=82.38 TRINITY_DN11504_c0_g2_i5:37-3378(+)
MSTKGRIAVIGTGISGLSAAYLLNKGGYDVILYEQNESCGGHALTDCSSPYPIDLGFQVFNLTTYPNFVELLEELGIDSEPSDMSFSLSVNNGELEWSGDNLDTIFAQRSNLLSPSFLGMVWEVLRFGRQAPKVLESSQISQYEQQTLGDYLESNGYSEAFKRHYVLPMCAAVWSAPESTMMKFPLVPMIRFWVNHHLLDIFQRPVWRVVKDRSCTYVKKILAALPVVYTSTQVLEVKPLDQGVFIRTNKPECDSQFDAVVMATHSDISLKLLGIHATLKQQLILQAIPYASNEVYLHEDASLMPRSRKVWASWNCLSSSSPGSEEQQVCVSYWANRLQTLPENAQDIFITLNPPRPPKESATFRKLQLEHPVFTSQGIKAQEQLDTIQGVNGIYFVGAWCGYGFHEDGLKSAINVVNKLGVEIPWVPRACSPKTSLAQSVQMYFFKRIAASALQKGSLRLILPDGSELQYGDNKNNEAVDRSEWRQVPDTRATIRVLDNTFFEKVVKRHDIGLGEAYMQEYFEVDDIGGFMAVMVANAIQIEQNRSKMGLLNWLVAKFLYLAHLSRSNTIQGSRRNISEHYDAGNTMYSLFLDETMTYSCGIHAAGKSLKDAQLQKLDELIKLANISSNDHVLEIGCGWGSFAIRAVQTTGCKVTGITISKEQLQEAQLRVRQRQLENKIILMFCDYRDIPNMGSYDKLVSIEMIEAVGQEHLKTYFKVISDALKPGGCAVIQAIVGTDERYATYCRSSDFIRQHIFPGGHLPCLGAIVDIIRHTSLNLAEAIDIGEHYAITLRQWRKKWEQKKDKILSIGYGQRFWRKYQFYFAYCEAAFDAGYIKNYHLVFNKSDADSVLPPPPTVPSLRTRSSTAHQDSITQLLLCLYFFLIGTVITQHKYMWIMPLTAMLYMISSWYGSIRLKVYSSQEAQVTLEQQWDLNTRLQLAFALTSSLGASTYLCMYPEILDLTTVNRNEVFGTILTCYAAGFYSSQLWTFIHYRLYLKSSLDVLHFAIMLFFFASGAYKYENSAFLSTVILSQIAQAIRLLGTTCRLEFNYFKLIEFCFQFIFGTMLNVYQVYMVSQHPEVFSAYVYYLCALFGMLYFTCYNTVRLLQIVP